MPVRDCPWRAAPAPSPDCHLAAASARALFLLMRVPGGGGGGVLAADKKVREHARTCFTTFHEFWLQVLCTAFPCVCSAFQCLELVPQWPLADRFPCAD